MARPKGHPKSGGRKKGMRNKATLLRERELAAGGELPLDHMLRVMRDPTKEDSLRFAAAKAAAPYCHPHLSPTTLMNPRSTGPSKIVVEFVRAKDGRPAPPDDLPAELPANVARLPLAKTG
jgi:hypothetical protein